jgi:hypothetical protein
MGFIRAILFIIIVYYLVRIVTRYILPLLFGNYMNRRMNDFSNRYNTQQHNINKKKEGEVTIDASNTGPSSQKRKDRGEYIEYEEIKD